MENMLIEQKPGAVISYDVASRVKAILDEGTAENTRKAYRSDIDYFASWARMAAGYEMDYPVPAALLIRFITDHLGGMDEALDRHLVSMGIKAKTGPHSLNTISRRIASLSAAHEALKVENPCRSKEVSILLSKARRAGARKGEGPAKKRAATRDILDAMLATCGDSLIDTRDRALLLFAFSSGGRRRSEVAGAKMENLTEIQGGFLYRMPYSKTDQEGEGKDIPIIGRAALVLSEWLTRAGIGEEYIFRALTRKGKVLGGLTDKTVARIVKKRASLAGLDASVFGGHSLRSGFITEAGRQGVSLGDTMALSGHKTVRVALGYHQAGSVINNPAALLMG